MSEQNINKEAYKQAQDLLLQERIGIIRDYITNTLRKIEEKKEQKEKIEEELRILKFDLEDLQNGKFEKIKERKEKSPTASNITAVRVLPDFNFLPNDNLLQWREWTGGTYNTQHKTFYL
jgi:uncharacterized membrane protein